jgi:hypothetical protein
MTDSRLSSLGKLPIESERERERAKALSVDTFVDVFAASHNNSRIGLQLF